MDDNLAILLVMTISVIGAVVLIVLTARIRAGKLGRGVSGLTGNEPGGDVALLAGETEQVKGRLNKQEERLRVLERIATDPAERTAREIDGLR